MSCTFWPNIIETAPENLARLTFPNGIQIEPGKELTLDQIKLQPNVSWDADLNGLYTIFLINSDSTSHKKSLHSHSICHWMIINIPGNNLYNGKVLIEYNVPAITKESGTWSFILLIFKQADTITSDDFIFKITKQKRILVKTKDYRTKHSIGDLVAGNFFKVQDEMSSQLLDSIG